MITKPKLVYRNFPHSSAIEEVSFFASGPQGSLWVKFRKNGVTYEYPNFPMDHMKAFLEDAERSPGKAFHAHIRSALGGQKGIRK